MTELNSSLWSSSPLVALEAHSPLSAQIAVEAGSKAIWVSSLTVSAALGMRDRNELCSNQMAEVADAIVDAVSVPVLVDGDNGYGDFNNARLFSRRLSRSGVAAVVFEDKVFPKHNSFWNHKQALLPKESFQGIVKASKDIQTDKCFKIIARTEALVAGHSVDDALERAHAYADAGADAIFIHSKNTHGQDIIEFGRNWNRRTPVVVAPTTYPRVGVATLYSSGIEIIIWANHLLRASVKSMQHIAKNILDLESPISCENQLIPLEELFRITKVDEVNEIERDLTAIGYG